MNDTASDVLSSVLNTSVINVPTYLQRTDDFRSTAPEAREVEGTDTEYYKHVDWSYLLQYEGVPNGKGASKSPIWKYAVHDIGKDGLRKRPRSIADQVLTSSAIHFSFDLWTSRNLKALCGINVHFADEYGNLKTFLLALPQQEGKHTGTNIADTIAEIISRFSLDEKIGFFVANNASNNDTCISALANKFHFNAVQRRLRCAGHIFNLVARALLWGVDEDAFLIELAGVEVTEQELECWRCRGPIGKVRNTIVYIRASP
ncbi:hypothetical protein D6C81_10531 [Aureobasidium pullulans]|nr:hypothetical protein D6C81_10531 [Aureobasidium pullulans]